VVHHVRDVLPTCRARNEPGRAHAAIGGQRASLILRISESSRSTRLGSPLALQSRSLEAGPPRQALGPELGVLLAQVVKRGGEVEKKRERATCRSGKGW
jgi:hypothetical protein